MAACSGKILSTLIDIGGDKLMILKTREEFVILAEEDSFEIIPLCSSQMVIETSSYLESSIMCACDSSAC
jgi:hypothetical protein